MGKQRAQGVNTTVDSLGIQDIESDPVIQQARAQRSALDSTKLYNPQYTDLGIAKGLNYDKSELDKYLPGGVDISGTDKDIEHQLGDAQGGFHQLGDALMKFVPMVGIDLAKSVTNLASGAVAGTERLFGDKDAFTNFGKNSWDNYLGGVENELKQALPIYSSTKYDNSSLPIFTSKFWTDDVSDGLAFVVAQAIGAKGLGAAIGAAGEGVAALTKSTSLAELYNSVPITQRIASAVANKFTTGTVGFLNAASISAMQAKGTANQIEQKMRSDYAQKINPQTGSYYTPDEIDQQVAKNKTDINDKTNNTFWATMATELLPSIYASKLFLGASKAEMGELNTQIMKDVNAGKYSLEDIEKQLGPDIVSKADFASTAVGQAASKNVVKSALSEAGHAATVGTIAMNLQQAIQKYDVDQASVGNKDGVLGSAGGYARQFLDNFTTDEGIKGIVMGAILGAASGAYGGRAEAKQHNAAIAGHMMSMRASDALFGELPKGTEKTEIGPDGKERTVFDNNGNPVQDPEKLTKIVFQSLHNKNNWDNQTAAIVSANQDMATMNDHVMLAQGIAHELQSGRYGSTDEAREYFKWFHGQRVKEQGLEAAKEVQDDKVADSAEKLAPDAEQGGQAKMETQSAMSTGSAKGDATLSKRVNDSAQLIDKMFGLWDIAGKQSNRLTKLGESSDRTDFNDNVKRSLYYEGVKREAMKTMLLDREAEMKEPGADRAGLNEQTEVLQNLMNDSDSRTHDFLNNHQEVYEEWKKQRGLRTDLYTNMRTKQEALKNAGTEENARAASTASYKFEEHADKEGVNLQTGRAATDTFLTNDSTSDILATPIGSRNEMQYKAGMDYMKQGRLSDMIDKVRSGELPLKEAVNYATDNLTKMDVPTKAKLNELISEQQDSVTSDEKKLDGMDNMTEDMEIDPEYAKLEQSINERKQAITDSQELLKNKATTEELNTISRGPDKIEETLNKQFAEKQFDKANNVLDAALDSDGKLRDSYGDNIGVASAIAKLTRMRDAMEDRVTSGDLKDQTQYNPLIARADKMIARLRDIADQVAVNAANRDAIQKGIADNQAHANAMGLGYDLRSGEVSNQGVFNAAASILGGTDKLQGMLDQLHNLPSGNMYEGSMAILHAIKSKGSPEQVRTLLSLASEQIADLVNTLPDSGTSKTYKAGMIESPELYFSSLLQSFNDKEYSQAKLNKGTPLGNFILDNNIDKLQSTIEALPDDTKDLGTTKENVLAAVRAYKEIVALNRVKNLLDSDVDLSKTVADELKSAALSSGIVPTAQQEISIRDGLAWLGSNSTIGSTKFDGWGFLRGIAGTGKTSVAVKWILDLTHLKPEEVVTSAATIDSAAVLGKATGTESMAVNDITNLNGKKLIVIDEYARLTKAELEEFEQKVRAHNKSTTPKNRVRVMILGDPSQITRENFGNQDVTSADGNKAYAKNIRVINPLTVVYRSDVSAISELSDKYQGNEAPVTTISVRSNKEKGQPGAVGVHAASNAGELIQGIEANIAAEKANGNTPRTRVVITEDPAKYASVAAMGVPVMSVYESQSQSYDEAYIDQDAKDFANTDKFNTAMYTAVSRARQYVYLKYTNEGSDPNFKDDGLTGEKVHNDSIAAQAKDQYITTRAEEKVMMEEAVKGNSILVKAAAAKEAVKAAKTPIEVETSSDIPDGTDTPEIVAEPIDTAIPEPDGEIDPETGDPSVPVQQAGIELPEASNLPNIEKGTFEALGGRGMPQTIAAGSKLHYMYTQEANGEPSVTAFAIDPEGNWIPVSKIFKNELETVPKYAAWNKSIKNLQAAGTEPIKFDPNKYNARGAYTAVPIGSKNTQKLGEGTITKVQRLTYRFSRMNADLQGSTLAGYIKGIFKDQFFSKNKATEQAKADNIVFRIFRHNELSGKNAHKFTEGGVRPEPGIPYAIVNGNANSRDWRGAQFVRLTASALNMQSEHYSTLKAYRDAVNDVAESTGHKDGNGNTVTRGIESGTVEFNRMVRAAREGLAIVDNPSMEGMGKKLEVDRTFTKEQFLEHYKKLVDPGEDFVNPIEHLSEGDAQSAIAQMQRVASMIYGLKEENTQMTASEMLRLHGEDYEHIPLRSGKTKDVANEDGTVTKEPLGYARVKGTGKPGIPDKLVTHWERDSKKGDAQAAFNQLAKANEFVGDRRIRVDKYQRKGANNQRITRPEGKSLITERGAKKGEGAEWQTRKVLANILAETRIKSGELDAKEADSKETRDALESEIRTKYRGQDTTTVGSELLEKSGLEPEDKSRLQLSLEAALNTKDSSPIDMETLNLMTDPSNYNQGTGEHLTQQEFPVTNHRGETESRQTYLRTPLEIDGDNGFNTLGADPEKNADALSRMVGTKFRDILPTQISAIEGSLPQASSEPVEQQAEAPKEVTVPGDKIELQDRIDTYEKQIGESTSALERSKMRKEQNKLINERDSTSRGFDENIHRTDVGEKITVQQATGEIRRLLPNIKDSEIEFLNKSLMLELQQPGESLLGLFQKGKMFFKTDDNNNVFSSVVRHEVFHKVYNDYLSQRDREAISKEFDPTSKLNPVELEEMLADKFMAWQKQPETVTGKIKRIFNKIAAWLGFAQSNASIVDKLFNDIENGKFQKLDPDTANTRRAFSDIKKWGQFQDYKDASRYLQNRIYDHFVDEHIDKMPVTQTELIDNIKRDMMAQANESNNIVRSTTQDNNELNEALPAMVDDADRADIQTTIEDNNKLIMQHSQKIEMLNKFLTEPKMLEDMWKDIYPNFSFRDKGIVSLIEDDPINQDPESQEQTEEQKDQKDSSLYADYIQSPEEKNQETKISQNVKNFLSFIYRPKGESDATRVNPRGVYLLCLRNLANMQTSEPDFMIGTTVNGKKIPSQFEQRAAQNGINLDSRTDAALVMNKLIQLWHNAGNVEGEYTFNNGKGGRVEVKLPENGRFIDENRFVLDPTGKNISDITEPLEGHTVIERNGRSTAELLQEVSSLNLSMDQAKGYFRQYQAQETLRELMSNFTSQREAIPMIAEETRDYTTTLRYFRAAVRGEERVQTSKIENAVKEKWYQAIADNWKAFDRAKGKEKGTAIADLMKAMGLNAEHVRGLSSNLVDGVYQDIKAFKSVVENTAKELKDTSKENASDTDEDLGEVNPVYSALASNSNMLSRLTQLMSLTSSDNRAGSYIDAGGTKKYLFHNGNQAADVVSRIMRFFGDGIGSLPKHLTEDKVLAKNIFATGLNKISSMLDHDGIKQRGREEFAVQYSGETSKQWLERNFSYSFLAFSKDNASNNDAALEYVQHFYTPSNRPRINSAVVQILPEAKIHEALVKGIEQHVEQPDTKTIRNYDRFKAVNFDELHKAIKGVHGLDVKAESKTPEGRAKLTELYDKIANSDQMKSELASHMVGQLKELAESSMQRMKKEGVVLGADANKAIAGMKDKRRQVLTDEQAIPANTTTWPTDEEMRPAVESFYMNNYVNSYFLNQAVAGNMNYFKDALDMVKRMSGVFAPGTKGLVGKFFMNPHFNVAISSDPKMTAKMLSPIFEDTELKASLAKEGFDLADAQGFMTQQRADNIIQGFGKNYKAGAVFKPAHYENVPRTLEDGSIVYTPVMLKYSSVILSDELIAKFPKLAALNAEMKAKGADEFVFNTGVKAGAPTEQVKLPGALDYENNNITIKPESIVKLSNENYRLQLNPTKEAYDKVANPTQLGYFLNVMHNATKGGELNMTNADRVYSAVAEKLQRGVAKLMGTALDSKGAFTTETVKKGLTGAGNKRILETLQTLGNMNMPNIADKALIAMAGSVDKAAQKIEFPGGKLVLQSSYGIDIPDGKGGQRRLEYVQDKPGVDPKTGAEIPGRWHAEVLLPKIYMDKANPGDFLLPDAMGFRIPSTELHSSVPLKVAGFYDDKGSNMIVAPAELVAQHGSDFDVDSLSVITRELAKSDAIGSKGEPVGYYWNDEINKYEFDRAGYQAELDSAKAATTDPKLLKQLEALHDQLLTNQITEAFLDTISHPDNLDRMLTPISTQVIKDALDELGIAEDKNVNLSRLEDNLKVYNSNFQGATLTGIFANGPKAISYLSRSGPDGTYPELTTDDKGVAKGKFEWNGHVYDKFTEQDKDGGNLWKQMDALINTSVDNVKEQYLALMGATDKTGPAYIAAKTMGMPLKEAIRMMKQPVVTLFSDQSGSADSALSKVKQSIVEHAMTIDKEDGTKLLSSGQGYSDLRAAVEHEEVSLNDKYLDSQLSSDSTLGTTPSELAHQMAVLDQFEKVNKIGQDLSTFSSAISILQDNPGFYEDIQNKVDQWAKLGTVVDGKLYSNPDFSFNIDHLFQSQPNIAEAYNAFQFLKTGVDKTLMKHFPETEALVDSLVDSKIKLLTSESANREKIKNEVMSYLVSTRYSEELKDEKPIAVGPKKTKILTGKDAWSQRFTEEVEAKKKLIPNAFLDRMTVKKGDYGDSIRFANSSNPDSEEALEMQSAFHAIPDEQLKQDFVKYAVLNYGLNFGMRNYSMFVPPDYLTDMSNYIDKNVKSMVTDTKLDENGKMIAGPLKQIRDLLAIKMAVNFPDKLSFINAKKTPPIQTVDAAGKPKTMDIGDKIIPVLSGYDGKYYWNRAYENPDPKPESVDKFPEFIKQRDGNGKDVVYKLVNDVTIDNKAYYQKVAYKNYLGGYDGSLDVVRNGYNPDDYFAKGTIPVPVADISTGSYEVRNEHIEEGSRVVIYPYSNATRELGITGIAKDVKTIGDKTTFSIEKDAQFSKQLDGEATPDTNTDHLMSIASKVIEQTGLKLEISDKLPKGVKGAYQDGTVTLNPKLITADTVFHEVSHPLIAAIKEANPVWYQKLADELHTSTEGRAVLSKVNAKYPELDKDGREVEALVTAVGLEAANKLQDSSFRTMVQRLMRSIGNTLRSIVGLSPNSINLNNIGSADMAKLSIGDIAELLAGGKVDLSQLSSNSNEAQYSKDLGDEKPAKSSVMSRILEYAKSIIDPTKNEFGQEADTYTVDGKDATRVSREMDKFTFRDKKESLGPDGKPIPAEDAIAQRDADRMFRDKAPGETILIDGIEKTKEEYQAEKKNILLQGIAKGNIIHAKIQRFLAALRGDAPLVSELDSRIEELSSQVDKLPTAYDWVTKKGIFNRLMSNAGVNIGSHVPEAQADKIHSEVKVASPVLGIAGKVDMIVEKPDGRLRIVDWKTGSKLKDKYSSTILKYGYQATRITDNPLDRAKLQVMMYALTIKAEHPETKFDGLVVMHLPNEHEATMGRNALAVEVPSYLSMLEQYYRHEEPTKYAQLIEQSPRIFDPREYNAPLRADFAQEVMNSNGSSELEVKQKMELELQQLEYEIKTQKQDNALIGPTPDQLKRRSELVKMIGQANDLYGTDFNGALDPAYEIGLLKRWSSTLNDSRNPYIQSLNSHLKVRTDRANREIAENIRKFDNLLKPLIRERLGKDRTVLDKAFTSVDFNRLFQNFYTTKTITDDATGTKYIRRGMTNPSDHPTEYAALSPAEKALSDFMRTTMKDKYEKVMTTGDYAIVAKDDLGKTITKEDLYNSSPKGANFKWTADFFPKLVVTKEEVNSRMRGDLLKGDLSKVGAYALNGWRRFATDFFDNNAEGYNQRDYGLSVRYLGNSNTDAIPDGYSMNLENGYKKFMEQMIRKDHLDSTYMYGQAVKGVLENATDANGNPAFRMSAGLVEDQLRNILMRDTLNRGTGKLIAHGVAVGRNSGTEHTLSALKIYRSLKSGAAAATLWLQPQRSAVNAGQAAYMHGKEALVNSIVGWSDRKAGLTLNQDISIKGMGDNYAEAVAGQVAAFSGKGKSNFVHQLANELKLYNDLEEEGGKHNQYLTKGSGLLDTSNFGFMYKMPEEITNVQYGLNYMKNLEIKSGKYAGKSMYDMYKEHFNKETGTFDLPADFKRGTIQHGDGTTEDLAGLHPLEINKIHAGIGKIMGNYRSEEKTAMQMTILGDAMMMFKRWIPGMAIQQYQSKFNDPTMGSFELNNNSLDQKPGEDTYQWRSRIVEGRMRTFGGVLLHYTPFLSGKFDGYAISDLSSEQKKGLVDVGIAMGSWLALAVTASYALSNKKDNDTLKKFYASIQDRVQEEIWLPTMIDAATQPPAVTKKASDVLGAMWNVLKAGTSAATGGEDKDIYTERGDIRGMNELLKNVPLGSSWYETKKSVDNWNNDDATATSSPF